MIIALVGMPGSGKTVATNYMQKQGWKRIRFGQITQDELEKRGREINEENERQLREQLREQHGMEAFAKLNKPKIDQKLQEDGKVAIDGLRSLEELMYLRDEYGDKFKVLAILASPATRHERLNRRKERSLTREECRSRDLSEINNLNVGGSIALADYYLVNEGSVQSLKRKLDDMLQTITN